MTPSTQGDHWHDLSASRQGRLLQGHSSGPKVFRGLAHNISRWHFAELCGEKIIVTKTSDDSKWFETRRLWQILMAAYPQCTSHLYCYHNPDFPLNMPSSRGWIIIGLKLGSWCRLNRSGVGLRPCNSNRFPGEVIMLLLGPHLE